MKIICHIRMARSRKVVKRKGRKYSGGGSGIEPGGPLTPGLANGLMVHRSYDSCGSSSRPGQISYSPGRGLSGMSGGAYTNNLSSPIAGFAQIDKIPCASTQRGGVGLAAAKDMGVNVAYGARYTSEPSQWVGSTGAPVLLNRPLDGAAWSRSCSQTAGSRRKMRKAKKTRRVKKTRRANKSRKH
jgi:hypothetical protein